MKKRNKSLDAKTTLALAIIIFLLGMGGTMFYYAFYTVAYMKTFDIEVKTVETNHIGFNADPTLHFGKLPASGGVGKKELVLLNDWDIPLLLEVRVKGEAAQFIKVADNNFLLQPGEVRKLDVFAVIPSDFGKEGVYNGEAKIMYFRP